MTETDVIEIQQNVPSSYRLTLTEDEDGEIPIDLTGLTVFISVKELNDYSNDDDDAVITSKITVHVTPTSGITDWDLTKAETYVPCKRYKADVRVYETDDIYLNTGTFLVDIVPVVTRRLS